MRGARIIPFPNNNDSLPYPVQNQINPEYLREKTAVKDALNPRLVVVGQLDKKSGNRLMQFYKDFSCPKYRVSLSEAEIQKYIHNIFNANKVVFFNEMRLVCQRLGIKNPQSIFSLVTQSAEGVWNPEYGIKNLGPFEGNCLPKDLQAFLSLTKNKGLKTHLGKSLLRQNKHFRKTWRQIKKA